ncbi:MAG: rhodanese-like domain-containing protein [Actinomycetota bacterium]|jgi:hypothetical protein
MAISEVTVDQLAEKLAHGARLVDVREIDEYESGHIPGALHVVLGTVPDNVEIFRGDGPTYVVCKSGGRSMRACEFLADHGVNIVNVAGGTMAWIQSGRDTVAGDSPS